jgi:hypothetical protein
MAGVMALINQKAGAAQGSPNTQLYALAAKQTYSSCKTETGTTSSSCYFNDIDTGTIAMPCDYSDRSPNCTGSDYVGVLTGYAAGTGYDLATGLGSLNVANVVNAWVSDAGSGTATVAVKPASSTLSANETLSVPVTVTGSGATPTGTVVLTGGGYTSPVETLVSGSYTFTIPANSLTSGSDTLTVTYSGDSSYASNTGTASVTVKIMIPTVTVVPATNPANESNPLIVPVTVSGTSGAATPTGTVALTGGGYTSAAQKLSSGSSTFTIPANSLSVATDILTVTYSGDTNYATETGTGTVTIVQAALLTPTVTVTPAQSSVDTAQTLGVTVALSGSNGTPTGYAQLSAGTYTSQWQPLSSGGYAFTVPAYSLSAGTGSLKVSYSGDSIYAAESGTGSVSVIQSAYALALNPTSATVAPGSSASTTVTVSSSTNYTGTITLGCTLTTSPTNASYTPTCTPSGTVVMTNGVVSGTAATLNISTTAATSELVWPKLGGKGRGWTGAGGGAVLAFLVFLGVPRRKRNWLSMLGVLVMMAALGSLAGCGGGGSSSSGTGISGTTAGTYTFTVTGTGNDSAATTATTTFTVTVN